MINIFYEIKNFRIKNEFLFINEINILLNNEGYIINNNINYIFCNDDFILAMNKKYLNKNFYTDVIAFSYSTESLKFSILGDIYISIDRIIENSKKWNEFFLVELKRVMIHGVLHLVGYNDKKKEDRKLMKKKENFYLDLFQF